ncbi:MAG TPA: zf-HC2 domain-containing protein [Pyrinomonadaceae bacterium]|jgi:hypothetical protein
MFTLTCRRAAALLSLSLERALPVRTRLLLRLHLRLCAACARFALQLRLLRAAARQRARRLDADSFTDASARLDPAARTRLKRALDEQAQHPHLPRA